MDIWRAGIDMCDDDWPLPMQLLRTSELLARRLFSYCSSKGGG